MDCPIAAPDVSIGVMMNDSTSSSSSRLFALITPCDHEEVVNLVQPSSFQSDHHNTVKILFYLFILLIIFYLLSLSVITYACFDFEG
jgi:hypothetical protein